jgi:hypothetical protein
MEKELNLTGDQAEAIGGILTNHIRQHFQMTLDMMAGKKARGEMLAEKAGDAEEEEPEQPRSWFAVTQCFPMVANSRTVLD